MNELSLFTGIGGGLLGTSLLGWRPVCGVEIEPCRRERLLRRQRDGMLPLFPIWDDIRTFDGRPWCGKVDVVTGGFPCQPFSVAGKRAGAKDDRNMWPDTIRIIREVRPPLAFLENVPGILSSGYFGAILGDIQESGYHIRWRVLSAAELGAPHKRDRLWIVLADTESKRLENRRKRQGGICETMPEEGVSNRHKSGSEAVSNSSKTINGIYNPKSIDRQIQQSRISDSEEDVSDADNSGSRTSEYGTDGNRPAQNEGREGQPLGRISGCGLWWSSDPADLRNPNESDDYSDKKIQRGEEAESERNCSRTIWGIESRVGRVANGVPNRVDRLAGLGDSQVPAVVRAAWELLTL